MQDKDSWWERNFYGLCTCFCISGGGVKRFETPKTINIKKKLRKGTWFYYLSAGEMKKYIYNKRMRRIVSKWLY